MKKIALKSLDVDVINFILHNNKATIDELCNCFDVSPVNIRTVLTRIEEFVEINNLGKISKTNGHYFFEDNINFNFEPDKFLTKDLEKKERIVYIILKLIVENSINLTSISKELNISRITLNSDMDIIREIIGDFNLSLKSVQWKGVFFDGELFNLQKFSILFIAKLYIEDYFSSPMKKIVNPIVYNYFREKLNQSIEKKFINLTNKLYHHFNISLGLYHYFILLALLIFIHLEEKRGIKFASEFNSSVMELTDALNDILDLEDRELIFDNTAPIITYLSFCITKKFSGIYSIDTDGIIDEIFSIFNLDKKSSISQLLKFFINNIYFENKFFIPTYIKFGKTDENILKEDIAIKLTSIFEKYRLPFNKKDIGFLYYFLKNEITKIKKKNILIIDNSTMTWKANKLKEKLKHLEHVNSIHISSYSNFKYFPVETFKKYDIFMFIDLALEKQTIYEKKCYFINGYDLLKDSINFSNLF